MWEDYLARAGVLDAGLAVASRFAITAHNLAAVMKLAESATPRPAMSIAVP